MPRCIQSSALGSPQCKAMVVPNLDLEQRVSNGVHRRLGVSGTTARCNCP